MNELIYKQEAIEAMCLACGHDCDKSKFVYNAPQDEQVIMCPEHYALSTLPSASTDLSNNSPKLDNENGELISRQDAIRLAEQGQIQGFEWQFKKLCMLPSAQQKQRYTKEELKAFQHGIILSSMAKQSSQHWHYNKDTAAEIEFLERLYEKFGVDMRGEVE